MKTHGDLRGLATMLFVFWGEVAAGRHNTGIVIRAIDRYNILL